MRCFRRVSEAMEQLRWNHEGNNRKLLLNPWITVSQEKNGGFSTHS